MEPFPAGGTLDIGVTGLPARARWPRHVALALAGLIVAAGAFWALTGHDPMADRDALAAERATLFADLVALERKRRTRPADDATLDARREALVSEIAELDTALEALAPAPNPAASSAPEARPAPSSALQ